jgi:hypothetical protein
MPRSLPAYLTVPQVQDLLQVGRSSVYRAIDLYFESDGAEGIPAVRIGRLLRVPSHALIVSMAGGPSNPQQSGRGTREHPGEIR